MGKNGKKRQIRTVKLSDIRRVNAKRKGIALRAVRKVDPDFYPGKRTNRFFGRKNKEKGRILEEMDRIEKLRNNQDNKYDENRGEDK